MSLADAREQAAVAARKIDKDIDPGAEKVQSRKALRDAESFEELARQWVERWAKPNRKSWKEAERELELDAIPAWGKKKAYDIKRRDVIELIESIMDRGSPVMANRTLQLVKQVFKFGVQRGIIDASPAVAIDKPAKEIRRDRVLTDDEIKAFWAGLDKAVMTEDLRTALRLCLVTAQRRAEVAGMRRSEIDGDWWTIPKERTKNGKAHRVPLSPLAKSLIAQAGGDDLLFPSPRKRGPNGEPVPIEPRALTNAVTKNRARKVEDKLIWDFPRFCTHDLRRTAATKMTELGISRFDVGKVLNHSDHEITAVYDHYAYDQEKRRAVLAWGRRLKGILDGKRKAKVISMG
jgi:integrase